MVLGDTEFDGAFVIQGNHPQQVLDLLADAQIRDLLLKQPQMHLEVRDDEGWFGQDFPEGTDELVFQVVGEIMDTNRLAALYDLFTAILQQLCLMGCAYEDDPHLIL